MLVGGGLALADTQVSSAFGLGRATVCRSADGAPSGCPTRAPTPWERLIRVVQGGKKQPTPAATVATTPIPAVSATSVPVATPISEPVATPSPVATATPSPIVTATPSPVLTPTPTGTPTPTVAPTGTTSAPTPGEDPGFGAVFGSRPASGAVGCQGQSGVTISGHTFRGIASPTPAITIVDCHDVTIEANDFIDVAEPIYVRDSTNVTIEWNRYQNITGPHERDGSHRGNFTQWENSFGGRIANNEGVGGDTEDIISIYHSGGLSEADPLIIETNRFQGTNWTSASGSGIMLGDGGGSHVVVRGNTLVNPGQVGIGVAGGSDIHVTGNTIYGQVRPYSNVGIYTWAQGAPCSDIEVGGNTIDFTNYASTPSAVWDGGNCGPIAGWNTNDWNTKLDPAQLVPHL